MNATQKCGLVRLAMSDRLASIENWLKRHGTNLDSVALLLWNHERPEDAIVLARPDVDVNAAVSAVLDDLNADPDSDEILSQDESLKVAMGLSS